MEDQPEKFIPILKTLIPEAIDMKQISAGFHAACDNKGPILLYFVWAGQGEYKNDDKAFLFTITNPHNILQGNSHEMVMYIVIHLMANVWDWPWPYSDTTGKGGNTFTGATYEKEIYLLMIR